MTDLRIAQLNLPPGMIDFGVGQPSPSLLPLKLLRKAAAHRLSGNDADFLAYGAEQGNGFFRTALAGFLSEHYRFPVEADQLFVTAGASGGLDLLCTLFAGPGDTIFVEEPSYFLALRIFADHQLKIISLPMDADGLIVDALEEKLNRHKPVFLYTIPTFHNPSSVSLGTARRAQLVELSRKYNFLIIADEVYHLLNYGPGPPPPPLAGFVDSDTVFSLGSFSKILAPGLRLGWIQAGPRLLKRIIGCGLLDSGGGLNPFASALVCSAIEMGLQQAQLASLINTYTERNAALSHALKKYLPDTVRLIEPDGGFFAWLAFPQGVDTQQMLPAARHKKVGYLPGVKFSSAGKLKNCARLSFSYFDVPELEEGARRLGEVVEAYLHMR
ncbi:MAG: PLP-dependent aminotransferase family protein [Desulfobacteraceae bacterium]|nr:PLP-dependent aminotransferase family protein [Desulfobacteraceae bacterium]